MDQLTLVLVVSTVGPFLVTPLKKFLQTHQIQDPDLRATVHQTLTVLMGVGSSALNSYLTNPNPDWKQAVLVGVAAGAGAGYVRDFDRNVLGLTEKTFQIVDIKRGLPPRTDPSRSDPCPPNPPPPPAA